MPISSVATTKEHSARQGSLSSLAVTEQSVGRFGFTPRAEMVHLGSGAGLFTGSFILEHQETAKTLARRARGEFGAWLSLPRWDWYCTHTFRAEYVSPKEADRNYFAWLNSLKLAARVRGVGPPFWFRNTEYQDRGTLHFHSLIGGVGDIRRLLFKDFWELHGFARVEKYDPGLGAAHYVGKYLTKTAADIRFSHNLKQAFAVAEG